MKKNKIIVLLLVCLVLLPTHALAKSYDSNITVKFKKVSMPSSIKLKKTATYTADIEYGIKAVGVPIPWVGRYHVEIPSDLFGSPTYTRGEFKSVSFSKEKKGSMTGKAVREANKTISGMGNKVVKATFTAKAIKSGKSQAYMGTGPKTFPNANRYKTVSVKK